MSGEGIDLTFLFIKVKKIQASKSYIFIIVLELNYETALTIVGMVSES